MLPQPAKQALSALARRCTEGGFTKSFCEKPPHEASHGEA